MTHYYLPQPILDDGIDMYSWEYLCTSKELDCCLRAGEPFENVYDGMVCLTSRQMFDVMVGFIADLNGGLYEEACLPDDFIETLMELVGLNFNDFREGEDIVEPIAVKLGL